MKKIMVNDPTLRDGNHAIGHKLSLKQIAKYAELADKSGIDIIEVGHGNGLGATSYQLGMAAVSDKMMLAAARKNIRNGKLGIHIIPGFGKIMKDLGVAIDEGVDVIRVASHCTEADTTKRYIEYAVQNSKEAYGVLMMSHMADETRILEESKKMVDYGAKGIVLMDSAGALVPDEVKKRISLLAENLEVIIGFHAHNNLGMAISNSLVAIESGACLVDATIRGFGAGAGNCPAELIVAVMEKMDYKLNVDFYKLLDLSDEVINFIPETRNNISSVSIISGLYGVFSGFIKPVYKAAEIFKVNPKEIFKKLGEKKIIAGQEDLIIETARELSMSN